MSEKVEGEVSRKTYRTKFRLLAVVALVQSIALWYIIYNNVVYDLSVLENIFIAATCIIFYSFIFVKKHVKTFVNKALDW